MKHHHTITTTTGPYILSPSASGTGICGEIRPGLAFYFAPQPFSLLEGLSQS